jgi:CheY-like chemotaxis protein
MESMESMDRNVSRVLEGEPKKILRILIVEDQKWPLKNIEDALKKHVTNFEHEVAYWYTQAEEMIRSGCEYDVILLDHRMPYDKPDCTEDGDFNRFCDQLRNIGYGLVSVIRDCLPKAIVIGTSSLSQDEIRHHGYSLPEKTIEKLEARNEIPRVFAELNLL